MRELIFRWVGDGFFFTFPPTEKANELNAGIQGMRFWLCILSILHLYEHFWQRWSPSSFAVGADMLKRLKAGVNVVINVRQATMVKYHLARRFLCFMSSCSYIAGMLLL